MAKVCIDAGHFGYYNKSPFNSKYWESQRMWKLHELVADELEKRGIEVRKTRTNQAADMALTSRGKMAAGCDVFLSFHSNASSRPSVDYTLAIVPLNGSGTELGQKLADCIAAVMGTTQKGRTMTKRGNSGDYYGVIRGAVSVGVPGIILEHSFHTNPEATAWLMSDANLQKLAKAEAECIAAYLKVNAAPAKPAEPEKDYKYKVRVTIDDLNIRKGPGTKYASKGHIKPGVYRIKSEKGIWLELYSGEGWISSKYVTKLEE